MALIEGDYVGNIATVMFGQIQFDSKACRKAVLQCLLVKVCHICGGIKLPWRDLKEEDKCNCNSGE